MNKIEIPDHELKNLLNIFPQGIVVFDLETTGLSALSDMIIEIGAIKVSPDGKVKLFQTLINPQITIPAHTIEIHHITDDMVCSAPLAEDALTKFLSFIEGYPLLAYNAKFDIGFILNTLHRYEIPFPKATIYDSWNLSKKVIPKSDIENYKLTTVAKKLQLPLYLEHRAFDDALICLRATANLLDIACKKLSLESIEQQLHVFNVGPFMERLDFNVPEHLRAYLSDLGSQEIIELLYSGGSHKNQYRPIRPIGLLPLPHGVVLYGVCLLSQMNKSFALRKIVSIRWPSPIEREKWKKVIQKAAIPDPSEETNDQP